MVLTSQLCDRDTTEKLQQKLNFKTISYWTEYKKNLLYFEWISLKFSSN